MADKIQKAYEASKNIYDDVLTQGSIFSKLYIKFFWSGTAIFYCQEMRTLHEQFYRYLNDGCLEEKKSAII